MVVRDEEPTWQPISMLPVVASLVDGSTAGAEEFYATLLQAKWKPHVLDDATVVRSIRRSRMRRTTCGCSRSS